MLEVRDITKIYNPGTLTEQRLFEHFSLTVEEGQFVAIVGSNGSGKTYICIGIGEHCYIWMDKNNRMVKLGISRKIAYFCKTKTT